jgi:hypothetical protein
MRGPGCERLFNGTVNRVMQVRAEDFHRSSRRDGMKEMSLFASAAKSQASCNGELCARMTVSSAHG